LGAIMFLRCSTR